MNKHILYLSLVLIANILFGISFLIAFPPEPIANDAVGYDTVAWNLVQGYGYTFTPGVPYASREPGYSMFLAWIYFIFGHSLLAVRLIQILINSLTCLIIYLIGKEIGGHRLGFISAVIATLYPPLIAHTTMILSETWFTFLLLVSLLLLGKALKANSLRLYFLSGLLLGLATLTRGTILLLSFFILVGLLILYQNKKMAILHFGGVFLGVLIFLVPWIVRNYFLFKAFIPIKLGVPEAVWAGNYIPWDGDWVGYVEPLTSLKKDLDPVAADKKLMKETFKNIKENPIGIAWIWLKKIPKMWLRPVGGEVYIEKNFPRHSLPRIILRGSLYLIHEFIIVVGLLGIYLSFRRKEVIFLLLTIVYFLLAHLPVCVVPRYNLPTMPIMIIFCAIGILNRFEELKKRWGKTTAVQIAPDKNE